MHLEADEIGHSRTKAVSCRKPLQMHVRLMSCDPKGNSGARYAEGASATLVLALRKEIGMEDQLMYVCMYAGMEDQFMMYIWMYGCMDVCRKLENQRGYHQHAFADQSQLYSYKYLSP